METLTQKRIKEIISAHDFLYEWTLEVINKLSKLDPVLYGTVRGIEDINIGGEEVNVECDNTWHGCYDTRYFKFPTAFLTMSDDELSQAVLVEKQKREDALRLETARKNEELRAALEKREKIQYERLKKKFND